MKYSLILMALLATSANATNYGNPLQGSSAVSNSSAIATQGQMQNNAVNVHSTSNGGTSTSNSGGNSINVQGDDAKRIPVATASGSFSNTTAECRYLQANSVQFLVFGGSNTSMVRDIVCTLGTNLNAEQKLALCIESAEYRKIRKQLGNECEIK